MFRGEGKFPPTGWSMENIALGEFFNLVVGIGAEGFIQAFFMFSRWHEDFNHRILF